MIDSEFLEDALIRLFESADCATYPRSEIADGYYLEMSLRYHPSEWYINLRRKSDESDELIKTFYLRAYYDNLYDLFNGESGILVMLKSDIEKDIHRNEQEAFSNLS